MIKFITENKESKELTFDMVEENQFFIDTFGRFCQKVSYSTYNIIADRNKTPHASIVQSSQESYLIKKIFPKVLKIEFDNE